MLKRLQPLWLHGRHDGSQHTLQVLCCLGWPKNYYPKMGCVMMLPFHSFHSFHAVLRRLMQIHNLPKASKALNRSFSVVSSSKSVAILAISSLRQPDGPGVGLLLHLTLRMARFEEESSLPTFDRVSVLVGRGGYFEQILHVHTSNIVQL